VWYGSPQWPIEALQQLEIPPDRQKKTVSCPRASLGAIATDTIAAIKAEYVAMVGQRRKPRRGRHGPRRAIPRFRLIPHGQKSA
jgi:hypothetical protein